MNLLESIADMKAHRKHRSASVFGSDRVYALLDEIERLEAEITRCHERLEIDHWFNLVDGEIVCEQTPRDERRAIPDAVSCRDETIKILEENIDRLKDELGDPEGVIAHADAITARSEAAEARAKQAEDALAFADKRSRIRADDNEDLRRRLAAVEGRLRRAEELLKPFADLSAHFNGKAGLRPKNDGDIIASWATHTVNNGEDTPLTVGHLRAAARFLERGHDDQ